MIQDNFNHAFEVGGEYLLKEVSSGHHVGNPTFILRKEDQKVVYFDSYVSVGNRAVHRFVQLDESEKVNTYIIRDSGIKCVKDGLVIPEPDFGYGQGRLVDERKESQARELLEGRVAQLN